MKIVYLSGSVIPSRTANSIQVMKMCQALAQLGHSVRLIARWPRQSVPDDWQHYGVRPDFEIVKTRRPHFRLLGRLLYPFSAAALALDGGHPDLLYARHLPSLLLAARPGMRLVFEAHMAPSGPQRALLSILFRRRGFDALVVISEALKQEFRRLCPSLAESRILVAPDAADTSRGFDTGTAHSEDDASTSSLRIGFIGHLYPGKGMEMVAALAARLPDLHFHVVGGTRQDVELWQAKTRELRNLTLHGFVAPAQTDSYRQEMDVLLAPYQRRVEHSGGRQNISDWMSPLKIFEYMAAAKPIVASDLPAIREVLTHEDTALLVDPEDLDEWVAALKRLESPRLREQLAKRAHETFESRYTWKQRARSVLANVS
jgi:glycosyltransferase involved in cell wall biosynthesis